MDKKYIKGFLGRTILPMLLGIAIMSSIIYDYRSIESGTLTAISAVYEIALFIILDALYHSKHKFLRSIVYIAMLAGALVAMSRLITYGYHGYGVPFNVWFYAVSDYVPYYLYALIFGGGFLFYSALYYFTQVRYRGLFTLLLVIFPFAIYAKRLDVMPNGYLAAILFLYLLVMVHNRQTAADSGIIVVPDKSYAASIIVFAVAVVGILFLIPKPEIESVQEKDASVFNDLSLFDNEAPIQTDIDLSPVSERDHGIYPTGRELFYVNTDEDIVYLKTQSFSFFEKNMWRWGRYRYEEADYVWTDPEEVIPGMSILNKLAILEAYCEQYGDEERLNIIDEFRQQYSISRMFVMTVSDLTFRYLSVPELTLSVDSKWYNMYLPDAQRANNYCNGEWEIRRNNIYGYEVGYESGLAARELAARLDMTSEEWDYIMGWYHDRIGEDGFSGELYRSANNDRNIAAELDNGEYDEYDDSIRELAEDITEGCTSDYEKAAALEAYFDNAGFTYDLSYVPDDDSIEYFIFESKTGICSDFATAMTLMARSVGLTARYCEGYIAFEKAPPADVDNRVSSEFSPVGSNWLTVRDSNAHAFVEIYLPACGWVVFEPTVSGFEQLMNIIPDDNGGGVLGFLGERGTYIFLVLAAAAVVLVLIFIRPICEAAFRIYISRADGGKTVRKLYARLVKRVSRKLDMDLSAYTVDQMCKLAEEHGMKIGVLGKVFEKTYYGGIEPSGEETSSAYEQYKAAYKTKLKPQTV